MFRRVGTTPTLLQWRSNLIHNIFSKFQYYTNTIINILNARFKFIYRWNVLMLYLIANELWYDISLLFKRVVKIVVRWLIFDRFVILRFTTFNAIKFEIKYATTRIWNHWIEHIIRSWSYYYIISSIHIYI